MKNRQINSFDVLRLFAAVLVVYGHAYPLTGNASPHFGGNSVQSIGVKIFFVISGYLIMGSWQRDPSAGRFAARRALRIMPGLAVVVLLSALVIGPLATQLPLGDYFASPGLRNYFSNIALYIRYQLPGVFTNNVYPSAVNGSLWSLPAEVAMYVIGPVAWVLGSVFLKSTKWGVALVTLMLMLLSAYFVRIQPIDPPLVIYGSSLISFLDTAPYFLLGAVYALFHLERFLQNFVALSVWFAFSFLQVNGLVFEILLYLILPYVILTLGLASSGIAKWLSKYGDISYGVYLYGFPIQQLMSMYISRENQLPWINFSLALPLVLVLATLSWRLVEHPFLRLKPHGVSQKTPVNA